MIRPLTEEGCRRDFTHLVRLTPAPTPVGVCRVVDNVQIVDAHLTTGYSFFISSSIPPFYYYS